MPSSAFAAPAFAVAPASFAESPPIDSVTSISPFAIVIVAVSGSASFTSQPPRVSPTLR